MTNQYDRIPAELRALEQWVVWKYEETTNGKPTKVPYSVKTNRPASVLSRNDMATFSTCVSASDYSGLGFCFLEDDAYCGIDLDHTTEQILIDRQIKIHREFDSYSEISPSGQGLHIIVKGKVPTGRRRSKIEVYSSARFFAMTGNVYNDKPIAERQQLLDILWAEMGPPLSEQMSTGSFDEKYKDDDVLRMAFAATNGEKFNALATGRWADFYPSQSEADFAFINIVAFYTQSRNQIARIFRNSSLGVRPKAQRSDYVQYMLDRCLDNQLPMVEIQGRDDVTFPVDTSTPPLADAPRIQHVVLSKDVAESKRQILPQAPVARSDSPYSLPSGLLGEIAQFIYAAAPRQVPEIALAAAIGFMAGICGRAYNVSRTGLNQYILLLAETGTGKEGISNGIDELMQCFRTSIPASVSFRGPAEIASGAALIKRLKEQPCMFSILGEFGLRMQQMSAKNASSSEISLRKNLLNIYMKSGFGKTLQASIYSQKENNTEVIESPAYTILAESNPNSFYQSIDEQSIEDGLLPRFIIFDYKGKSPYLNKDMHTAKPSFALTDGVGNLMDNCLRLMHNRAVVNVELSPEVLILSDEFERMSTDERNNTNAEVIKQLWNRAHLKLLKLAALVAVGNNWQAPVIMPTDFEWARRIIVDDVERILVIFREGNVGKNADEDLQIRSLKNAINDYLKADNTIIKKYDLEPKMYKDKVIPYVYIQRRLVAVACFKHDKIGATAALKRAVGALVDSGILTEVNKIQTKNNYNFSGRAFVVARIGGL